MGINDTGDAVMCGGGDHYKRTTRKDEMRRELKDKRNRDLRLVYNVSLFMTGGMLGVAVMLLIIMNPSPAKWTLMIVYILLAILCGELSDKIEKIAVERCRSWHKNSDSVKNRAA